MASKKRSRLSKAKGKVTRRYRRAKGSMQASLIRHPRASRLLKSTVKYGIIAGLIESVHGTHRKRRHR